MMLRFALFLSLSVLAFPVAAHEGHGQHDHSAHSGIGRPDPDAPNVVIGGPFSLLDVNGKTVTEASFAGREMLVFFGFTHCPDICPTGLQTILDALDLLGKEAAKRYQPIFITLDPERDTPAVLAEYLSMFGPNLVGLTGTLAQIKDVAAAYKVGFKKQWNEDNSDYEIVHAAPIFRMDSKGGFVTLYPSDISVDELVAALREKTK